jgi:hypothetical protein
MLSEGNAAHPVARDSPLQVVKAVWRPFLIQTFWVGCDNPLLTIMVLQKAKGCHTRPDLERVKGAQESIPRNQFLQQCSPAGRSDNPIPTRLLSIPINMLFKIRHDTYSDHLSLYSRMKVSLY